MDSCSPGCPQIGQTPASSIQTQTHLVELVADITGGHDLDDRKERLLAQGRVGIGVAAVGAAQMSWSKRATMGACTCVHVVLYVCMCVCDSVCACAQVKCT